MSLKPVSGKIESQELNDNFSYLDSKKIDKGEISVRDINKNKGLLDETYMSDEFLQQMAGDTPIHSRPAGLSITTQRHAFSSVTPDKTSFIKQSSNLYNYRTTLDGKYIDHNDEGAIKDSDQNKVSDLINVFPDQNYSFYGVGKIVFYDIDANFISHEYYTSNEVATVTTPNGAYYMRLQIPIDREGTQINIGDELLPYEDYYNFLDKELMPDRGATYKKRTPLGHIGFLHNLREPNVNLTEKKVVFEKPLWISVGSDRYSITGDGAVEVSLHPSNSYQYVVYNAASNTFQVKGSSTSTPAEFDEFDIVVMFLTLSNSASKLEHAFCTTKIKVNGKPYPNNPGEPIESSINYQFVPEVPYYEYEADTLPAADGTGDFDHHSSTSADVYAKYDELIDEHSDYITKAELGKDASGTLPIYELSFNPEQAIENDDNKPLPKIIINCAMHGDGDGGFGDGSPGDPPTHAYSLYYFFKEICDNWQSSKALEYLRWNVKFIVNPISNPWGFDNKSRYNSEGIDINRDFGTFNAIETQYIRDMYLENKDAIVSIDYHMIGGLDYISDDKLMRYFINKDDEASYQISEQTMRELSRRWHGKYGLSDILFYGLGAISGSGPTLKGWGFYSAGIPTITLEGFLATEAHREKSGSVAMTMNVEHLGNWFMSAVRYFYTKN